MSISDASEPTLLASQGDPSFLTNEPSFSNFRYKPTLSLKFVPYLGQEIALDMNEFTKKNTYGYAKEVLIYFRVLVSMGATARYP